MDKNLTTVWNTETQEIGFLWNGIIFTFYDDIITLPPEVFLNRIIIWLATHSVEIRESIAHVMVDVDSKVLHVFFKDESQELNFIKLAT